MSTLTRALKRNLRPSALFVNRLALILISAACLLPVVWTVSASLKDRNELYMATPALIPRAPTLANYTWMFSQADMSRLPLNMWNSVKVTLGAVVIQSIMATMAGFAFARLEFRGRDLIFYLLILLMFVPRAGGLMALYELMDALHLRNSHLGPDAALSQRDQRGVVCDAPKLHGRATRNWKRPRSSTGPTPGNSSGMWACRL